MDATNLQLHRNGPVATIQFLHSAEVARRRQAGLAVPDVKLETADLVLELGRDDSIRVIVLTGSDGEFKVAPRKSPYVENRGNAADDWELMKGLPRVLHALVDVDTPVVAKVNGDAVGFGSSLVFACDFIFADENARLIDHHLGMGEEGYGRPEFGVVAGDGGMSFVPLALSPAVAREYLFLGMPLTGRELAAMRVINGAFPADKLDAGVDAFVARLVSRPRAAMAWSKRVFNRRVRQHVDLTLDSALAYEMLNFYQGAADLAAGRPLGDESGYL